MPDQTENPSGPHAGQAQDGSRGDVAAHAQPIAAQGKWLWYVVNGYFNYHAVPTNSKALVAFRTEIAGRWRRVLIRRSERTRLNWKQMQRLVDDWLPKPRVLHPWPNKRFAVRYLR